MNRASLDADRSSCCSSFTLGVGLAGDGVGKKLFKKSKIPGGNLLLHDGSGERISQLGELLSDLETDDSASNTLNVTAGKAELQAVAEKTPEDGLSTTDEGICAAYTKLEIKGPA